MAARLRTHPLPARRHVSQRPARGPGAGPRRLRDRAGPRPARPRRARLGRARLVHCLGAQRVAGRGVRRFVGGLRHQPSRPGVELPRRPRITGITGSWPRRAASGWCARTGKRSRATSGTSGSSRTQPDDAEFERTAVSFDNPDWADVTLHSYRSRWGHAAGDPCVCRARSALRPGAQAARADADDARRAGPGELPAMSEGKEAYFSGPYERRLIAERGPFSAARRAPRRRRARSSSWLERYR